MIGKELQALHIIKAREIDVKDITETTDNYELYVAYCEGKGYAKDYICSQSEFELLRKVLVDDSKEALKRLQAYCTDYDSAEQPILNCEQELEALEFIYTHINYEEIDRLKRVLNILRTKEVALECVKASSSYKEYAILVRSMYGNVVIAITKQEYNLLKEWLNNG